MDRNSIIGLLLIFAILIGYTLWMTPSKEEIESRQHKQDSIRRVQSIQDSVIALQQAQKSTNEVTSQESTTATTIETPDSGITVSSSVSGAPFSYNSSSNDQYIIETDLLRIWVSSRGGRIAKVELIDFKTYEGKPLILFNEDSSSFGFSFFVKNQLVNTNDLFFLPGRDFPSGEKNIKISGEDSLTFSMFLYANAADPLSRDSSYIEFLYTIHGNKYMVDFDVNFKGLGDLMGGGTNFVTLDWTAILRQQEKSYDNEKNVTTIYYKYINDDVENLSERKDDEESLKTRLKWISFKQQFFSSILIADDYFNSALVKTKEAGDDASYLKAMETSITIPVNNPDNQLLAYTFYFGPNKFSELKSYGLGLENLIPLGWGILSWINKFIVIPVFNFLDNRTNLNYGIIILILTILLKLVLFPIAYKTYMSSAKMKILKPEVDALAEKFPKKDDAMKKQQATMALYKKAGVNPMAGCVPMLLQMPILIALFRFFPASIELRQQSFLWADDLSTYDSVLDLPVNIPFYGDHVSLFTLLMTVSTIMYTRINNQMMATSNQMPGMKTMMYMMPIMFLGFFNSYASGLSYYYLLANLITFGQMFLIRKFVNEEKLYKKLEANKKKPVKKSGFQKRLEDMAKQRGQKTPQKKRK